MAVRRFTGQCFAEQAVKLLIGAVYVNTVSACLHARFRNRLSDSHPAGTGFADNQQLFPGADSIQNHFAATGPIRI